MVLVAAVEVVAAYQVVVPLDKAHTLVLSLHQELFQRTQFHMDLLLETKLLTSSLSLLAVVQRCHLQEGYRTVEAILYGPVRRPKFNPQKRGPNSDRCLRDSFLRSHAQTAKANATYQNWFHELKPMGNEKHHLYDFHFSLRQSNQERICCRSTVEVLWNVAGNYKFRGAQIWAGKGCRHVSPWCQLNQWAKAPNKTTWRHHITTEHVKNPQTKGPHFRVKSSTSHDEDTAPSWKQLFLVSETLRARSARAFDNVTRVKGPRTLKKWGEQMSNFREGIKNRTMD